MPSNPPEQANAVLPLLREEVGVTTRVVDTGRGVRVSKVVEEHPEQVSTPLWREQVSVERVPVDRVVAEPPAARYEGDTLVMPVVEEVVVLEKRYRIKEELRITRTRVRHEYTETVALRSEQMVVERFDNPMTEERYQP